MDLFKKCHDFTRADEVKALGYYPYFRAIEENEGPVVQIEGENKIMAGSNNYLGLATAAFLTSISISYTTRASKQKAEYC